MEHGPVRLEKDIAIDRKGHTSRALDASIAHGRRLDIIRISRSKIHQLPRDHGLVTANVQSQVRQERVAGERPAAILKRAFSTGDLEVIGFGDGGGKQKKSSTRVGDGSVREGDGHVGDGAVGTVEAGGEAIDFKLPETVLDVDINEVEGSSEFRLVDKSEIIISSFCKSATY